MPRTARSIQAGFVYHVVNRGNRRGQVFHDDGDYDAFVRLLVQASARFPVRMLAFCLMPNHMHAALWPETDDGLYALMHWVFTTHAARYQRQHRVTGHVWQGRFKAFPIQEDQHLLTVLRYIERNPLRAGLVASAEAWRWSRALCRTRHSLRGRRLGRPDRGAVGSGAYAAAARPARQARRRRP